MDLTADEVRPLLAVLRTNSSVKWLSYVALLEMCEGGAGEAGESESGCD